MLVGIGNGTPLTEPKVNKDIDTRLRHNHRSGQNNWAVRANGWFSVSKRTRGETYRIQTGRESDSLNF